MVLNRSIATACMNFSKMALIFTDFPVGNGSKHVHCWKSVDIKRQVDF